MMADNIKNSTEKKKKKKSGNNGNETYRKILKIYIHTPVPYVLKIIFSIFPCLCTFDLTECTVLVDRNRPRSTRINKRFLSRTVASAALSRPTRGGRRATGSSVNCQSRDDDDDDEKQHDKQQQHRRQTAPASERRHRLCTDSVDRRRKHSAESDGRPPDTDRHSSHVYDAYDYVRLNREYKLDPRKRQTADSRSVGNKVNSRTNIKQH